MEVSKIKSTIHRYNMMLLLTLASFFFIVGAGMTIKTFLPGVFQSSTYQITARGLLVYLAAVYIGTIVYQYKTSVILKSAGKIKTSPALLTIVTVLSTPILFLIGIIVFVVIRQKAQKYVAEI